MRTKIILHYGDPVVGNYHDFQDDGLVVYMPYDDEEPTLDGLGYGEKKALMAFYSLDNEKLNSFTFYKIDDLWQAYFPLGNQKELYNVSNNLYYLCSEILFALDNDELTVRFINHMKSCIDLDKVDAFIDELKERFKNKNAKLVLVPSKNKKDID